MSKDDGGIRGEAEEATQGSWWRLLRLKAMEEDSELLSFLINFALLTFEI